MVETSIFRTIKMCRTCPPVREAGKQSGRGPRTNIKFKHLPAYGNDAHDWIVSCRQSSVAVAMKIPSECCKLQAKQRTLQFNLTTRSGWVIGSCLCVRHSLTKPIIQENAQNTWTRVTEASSSLCILPHSRRPPRNKRNNPIDFMSRHEKCISSIVDSLCVHVEQLSAKRKLYELKTAHTDTKCCKLLTNAFLSSAFGRPSSAMKFFSWISAPWAIWLDTRKRRSERGLLCHPPFSGLALPCQ